MSQEKIVLNELEQHGAVSRNWCLQNRITRLSAIIFSLTQKGLNFRRQRGERRSDDYVYHLVK